MNWLATAALEAVEWSRYRTADGNAKSVPGSIRRLANACSDAEAKSAYWELDNHVVVQGTLHEAAEFVVAPLLALLEGNLEPVVRKWVFDLLFEIAMGNSPESSGRERSLEERCRDAAREGLWTLYALLLEPDPSRWRDTIHLLLVLDRDKARLKRVLERLKKDASDPDSRAEIIDAISRV